MIIRRFVGTNTKEVQDKIHQELGQDAVIISTRYFQKGILGKIFGRYYVEVVAVIDHFQKEKKEVRKLKKLQEIAEDLDHLKESKRKVKQALEPHPFILDPLKENRIAFVGMQGAGKTTVCLKLALQYKHDPRFKIGLISLMERGKGGAQQLSLQARRHDLFHCYARNPEELNTALASFSKCNLIMIDADLDPRIDIFAGCLKEVPNIQTQLVVSGSGEAQQIHNSYMRYQDFHPEAAIVTRCDLEIDLQNVISILAERHLPVSYLSAGPEISCGIEEFANLN